MRYFIFLLVLLFSFVSQAKTNPFTLMSPSLLAQYNENGEDGEEKPPIIFPVASDCLKRPAFRGALSLLTVIDNTYYSYVNKCYWEAYEDVVPQYINGAQVIIAWWRPLASLPVATESKGEECRNQKEIENVQFSAPWRESPSSQAYYANYKGCLYYSYCGNSCSSEPYISTFFPVGEPNELHEDSEIITQKEKPKPPLEPDYVQPLPPPNLKVGDYVPAPELLDYYDKVFDDYCRFLNSAEGANVVCYRYGSPASEEFELPLLQLNPKIADHYYCHIKTLKFKEIGYNTCYLNDNRYIEAQESQECYSFDDDPRCHPNSGISPMSAAQMKSITEGINQLVSLSEAVASSNLSIDYNTVGLKSKLDSLNASVGTSNKELKKLNSTTGEILKFLKNNSGSGNGSTSGNYHGDIQKLNNDMNKNHQDLLETLNKEDNGEGEGEADFSQLKEGYELYSEEYGKGTLHDINDFISELFNDLPDLTVRFELPSDFYGQSQRTIGMCIPIKQQYTLNFTKNMNYVFNLDTTTACDYYDGYFRGIVNFIFYFLTALACYRLYNRFMQHQF